MTQWLTDTFLWTGVLIAAVLMLRRPVARYFGPQVAYALWALPLLRLLMPPLVLPASFAPVEADPAGAAVSVMISASPMTVVGFAFGDLLLPMWLGGAAMFLVWRAADYLRMRRELLADARPVGEARGVRLVETPDVASPVAFGLHDKVVALPVGFMAQHDQAARDLALAHELAHHRGHDLLANLLAQALLALHWFNPLAWAGWRAMRSDQEAACDARVMAGCKRSQRAAYAQVIAGFAAGPRLALAAPMACPVLGEKSIIHRLRNLTREDVSPSRRKVGLTAIATGALAALPLTASITYAQVEEPAATGMPQQVIRLQLQREAEEGEAASVPTVRPAAVSEPQIRRRIVIRRDNNEQVIDDGADEADVASLLDADNACSQGNSTTRRELEDGRQLVIICRRQVSEQSALGLRQVRDDIRDNERLTPEVRDTIIRELETEIEALEAEALSFAPTMPDTKFLVQVSGVHVQLASGPIADDASLILIPAAILHLLVPIAPKVPKGDLPI